MFLGRPCRCPSVRPSVRPSRPWFTWQFYVSAISPVSVVGFSPNFCHWCVLGHRWPDYALRWVKDQSSRSHHRGGGAQHSTLPSSATFSSFTCNHLLCSPHVQHAKTFAKMFYCFILHVPTSKTFLQMFCKCFILHVTTVLYRVFVYVCMCDVYIG